MITYNRRRKSGPTMAEMLRSYEEGEMEESEVLDLFQTLVNNGMAWTLQGHYGRTAQGLIDLGLIHA